MSLGHEKTVSIMREEHLQVDLLFVVHVAIAGGIDIPKTDRRERAKGEINTFQKVPTGGKHPDQRTAHDKQHQDDHTQPQGDAFSLTEIYVGRGL